ncbi:MAG: calcium binding protein 39, isoform CRA_b, partial [Olpidium bornovanus]
NALTSLLSPLSPPGRHRNTDETTRSTVTPAAEQAAPPTPTPKKAQTPQELVRTVKVDVPKLDSGTGDRKKASDEISKALAEMKKILYGENDQEPNSEQVAQLSQEVYNNDLLQLLVQNIAKLEFEAKKDVAQIFNNLLRRQIGTRFPTVDYLCNNTGVPLTLLRGYENPEIALNCGMILRECLRHEALSRSILHSPDFYRFFDYVEMSTFDIASDAFASFKDILTRHKPMVADYLDKQYDDLLGETLLDRANFSVMTRYISSADNLKLMMNLLRDKSRNIQFEAFHVFKVFVANPNKKKPILDILQKNRDKLITFLSNFHNDRSGTSPCASASSPALFARPLFFFFFFFFTFFVFFFFAFRVFCVSCTRCAGLVAADR